MRWLRLSLLALALAAAPQALAVQPDEILADAALEARARALSKELRCMVCQNQSIDDSDAPLARDLRVLVRERLEAGDSDQQVIDFLVARYGDFVLLKPRFTSHTALLWLMPAVVFGIGALVLIVFARRHRPRTTSASGESAKLTPAEAARLADIVSRGER
jgi:cytochrome c-type biogenesis protein CcmH